MLRCRARTLPSLYGYALVGHFYSVTTRVRITMRIRSTRGVLGHFVRRREDVRLEFVSCCWSCLRARYAKLINHQGWWKLNLVNMCVKPRETSKRATETGEQPVHRREQDKKHKASIRASETSEQTIGQYCAEGFALQCSSVGLFFVARGSCATMLCSDNDTAHLSHWQDLPVTAPSLLYGGVPGFSKVHLFPYLHGNFTFNLSGCLCD